MTDSASSRQFVAVDFAADNGGTFVAGYWNADGTVYVDHWEADSAPGPTITVEQGTFTADRAGWYSIGELRTAADFRVDLDAPPNSCTRCGADQRDHGELHAYAAPNDAVRLARMKSRRDKRLAAPPRYELSPETLVELRVDTGAFSAAMVRVAEGLGELSEAWRSRARPAVDALIESINQRTDERIARWREIRATAPRDFDDAETIDWGDPVTAADMNTPAPGGTCAHICGADPDHECGARATLHIEHRNLAGGTTRMPVCGPCHQSETAAMEATRV